VRTADAPDRATRFLRAHEAYYEHVDLPLSTSDGRSGREEKNHWVIQLSTKKRTGASRALRH